MRIIQRTALWAFILLLVGCSDTWNNPYPESQSAEKILYSSFDSRPKYLDPVRSYSSDEWSYLENILETPLTYHYTDRPYRLIPQTLTQLPEINTFEQDGQTFTDYVLTVKPGIFFAPHPLLGAKRELTADDYVYQIKRLAAPFLLSPIHSMMKEYIDGFEEFSKTVKSAEEIRKTDLTGVQVLSRYQYRIRIKGEYPQFLYWLAMPFFAPMPYELAENPDYDLNWNPVGTGAYQLIKNDPNSEMVLAKNPNYRNADAVDIEKVIYKLEKESIPYWTKFLQGYYDMSGVSSDSFDQAINTSSTGSLDLSDEMRERGIRLIMSPKPVTYYMGFNMLDDTVGGYSQDKQALRKAIAEALDYDEYISIFANGRGIEARGPVPPGITGHISPDSTPPNLEQAKQWVSDAGMQNKTIYLDTPATGPESKARLQWFKKRLALIDLNLVVRATDYNRFQEKIQKGKAQLYEWGWNADYPDPENFFFLLYSKNGKVEHGGANSSNYANPEFDALFEQMKTMPDSPKRMELINQMLEVLKKDQPWVWGWHLVSVGLYHDWIGNLVSNSMTKGTLRYLTIDPVKREAYRAQHNKPSKQPIIFTLIVIFALIVPAIWAYRKRQNSTMMGQV